MPTKDRVLICATAVVVAVIIAVQTIASIQLHAEMLKNRDVGDDNAARLCRIEAAQGMRLDADCVRHRIP
jgi:hypothetical protein